MFLLSLNLQYSLVTGKSRSIWSLKSQKAAFLHVIAHVVFVNVNSPFTLHLTILNLTFAFFQIDEQQVADKEVKISKNCCWCQQTLTVNDRPKLLECFHSCCEQCLKQEQQKAVPQNQSCNVFTINCPLCKTDNRSDFIINNHFLIEMLTLAQNDDGASGTSSSGSVEEVTKCTNCTDDLPATSYCVECREMICDNCVAAHMRLKITKDHTIKSKDAAETTSDKETKKEIKCLTHPQVRKSWQASSQLTYLSFSSNLLRKF